MPFGEIDYYEVGPVLEEEPQALHFILGRRYAQGAAVSLFAKLIGSCVLAVDNKDQFRHKEAPELAFVH